MNKLLLILNLILLVPQVYSQFNEDQKEIKAKKIKSITYYHEAKCLFDKEGRLIEYWTGDIEVKLEESNIPHGRINKFSIDTIGRFTKSIGLDFSPCTDSICDPDTISYQYWMYSGDLLDSSYFWDTHGRLSSGIQDSGIYLRSVFGDTIVEKLFDNYRPSYKPADIKIQFTVDLATNKKLFFGTEIPFRYLHSDSARYFIDSLNYGSRIIVDYKKKGGIKQLTTVNDNGDTINICHRFKDIGESYSCVCKSRWGESESTFSKKYFYDSMSMKIRVEYWHRNKFTLKPNLLLLNNYHNPIIEYYD